MKLSIRRLLPLVAVFAIAFVAVTAFRTWNSGGSLRGLLPSWLVRKSAEFRPEQFTLPDKAPIGPGEVELLSRLNAEYAKLTEAVVPSVVSIDTTGIRTDQQFDIFGRSYIHDYPTQGQGSGVIVN